MNLRQLRYFVAIAEERQLTAAARKLHITQPPLSYELSQLEKEMGVLLVRRGSRSVELTDAGRLLYRRAQELLSLAGSTVSELQSYGAGEGGVLRVGVISSSGGQVPTQAMRAFAREFPKVRIELREGNTFKVLDLLERGEVEVGVVRTPFPTAGLRCAYAPEEPMVAIMPRDLAVGASPDVVTPEELCGAPLIAYRRFETILRSIFDGIGHKVQFACMADDARTVCVWASRGLGIGLVPQSFLDVMALGHESASTCVKVVECDELVTRMALVCKEDRYVSPLAERFARMFDGDEEPTL